MSCERIGQRNKKVWHNTCLRKCNCIWSCMSCVFQTLPNFRSKPHYQLNFWREMKSQFQNIGPFAIWPYFKLSGFKISALSSLFTSHCFKVQNRIRFLFNSPDTVHRSSSQIDMDNKRGLKDFTATLQLHFLSSRRSNKTCWQEQWQCSWASSMKKVNGEKNVFKTRQTKRLLFSWRRLLGCQQASKKYYKKR